MSAKLTKEEFIKRSIKIHGDVYDYTKTSYDGNNINVMITCKVHGSFSQRPETHMRRFPWGKIYGCPECKLSDKISNFISLSNITHDNKYDYSVMSYGRSDENVEIICPIHGIFKQIPYNHLQNKCGCPSCAKTGFDKNKPASCYYIKFETEFQTLYKIGITNLSVKKRLVGMGVPSNINITILQELCFENGKNALKLESKILKEFKTFKYLGEAIMDNGNSELFTKDVLGLDIFSEI
jgi:hypothetical protein